MTRTIPIAAAPLPFPDPAGRTVAPAAGAAADAGPRLAKLEQRVAELLRSLAALQTGQTRVQQQTLQQTHVIAARALAPVTAQVAALDQAGVGAVADIFEHAFVAKITGYAGGLYSWTEQTCDGSGTLTDYLDGRTGTTASSDAGGAVAMDGSAAVAVDTIVCMLEIQDLDAHRYVFVTGGGGGGAGAYAVRVRPIGVDGDGLPTYDVFDLADTGLVTPLNAAPLTPDLSRWRGAAGINITEAPERSVGIVHGTGGDIALHLVAETVCTDESFPWETG